MAMFIHFIISRYAMSKPHGPQLRGKWVIFLSGSPNSLYLHWLSNNNNDNHFLPDELIACGTQTRPIYSFILDWNIMKWNNILEKSVFTYRSL